MKILKLGLVAVASTLALGALSFVSQAETISTFTSAIGPGATAQLGRLSRNGVQQDWIGSESYPGVLNPAAKYYYQTYSFSSSLFTGAPYVDISVFDETNAGNSFVSAYANSYSSTNPLANWLGDEGGSGDYFGTDARYFDVILPVGDSLILVVNTTVIGATASSPFDVTLSAYADTSYDDPAPAAVPEPSTLVTLGTGLLGLGAAARRRFRGKV